LGGLGWIRDVDHIDNERARGRSVESRARAASFLARPTWRAGWQRVGKGFGVVLESGCCLPDALGVAKLGQHHTWLKSLPTMKGDDNDCQ
jgi:hypothetical protein